MSSTRARKTPGGAAIGWTLVLGLFVTWFAAVSLRTGLIGVGPVIPGLTTDMGLSNTQASLLLALPTAMMGLAAAPGGRLADRLGSRVGIGLGLALVAIGGGLRAFAPSFLPLVLFTVIFGIGIGVSQPALPRLARGLIPGRIGLATSIYSFGLFFGSVIPSFVTAPYLLPLRETESWRLPLAIWGGLALAGVLVWIGTLQFWPANEEKRHIPEVGDADRSYSPWRNRGAWIVATVFLFQGVAYYLLIAWLPSVYEALGVSRREAGPLFAVYTLATFPGMTMGPWLSDRLGTRRWILAAGAVLLTVGALGFAIAPTESGVRWIWPALAGLGVSFTFAMCLILPTDIAPRGQTGRVAGMILAVGYFGSAFGPILGGVFRDLTGGFSSAMWVLPPVGVILFVLAFLVPDLAPRRRVVIG